MYDAEALRRCKVSHLELLLLGVWSVLALGCVTTSEGRYDIVPHMKVVRDVTAAGCNEPEVGQDLETPVSGSGIQALALGGRKLLEAYDDNLKELAPFIDFDYPGPGESTPITDPPPVPPYQTAAAVDVHIHVDYADPETHPPGDDDSDEAFHP